MLHVLHWSVYVCVFLYMLHREDQSLNFAKVRPLSPVITSSGVWLGRGKVAFEGWGGAKVRLTVGVGLRVCLRVGALLGVC